METVMHRPIIGVTGHRTIVHNKEFVRGKLKQIFHRENPASVITGMALGFDQLVAEVCVEMGIPFIAAVPFVGQEKLWPTAFKNYYRELLGKAQRVEIVNVGSYHPSKMHIRNQWIVNNSDKMVSYFDNEPKGGTFSCVRYARSKKKEPENIFELLDKPRGF